MTPSRPTPIRSAPGFSLVEILVVMVIIGALTAIGMSAFGNTAQKAQRTAVDRFMAAVEQARTTAITKRKPVILAVAEPQPGDVDDDCRFGLFEVDELPAAGKDVNARQLQRWNTLPGGIVFFGGRIQEFDNLLDQDKIRLTWKNGDAEATVRVLAFDSRGGLAWPEGSDPLAVKLGGGTYRNGVPVPVTGGGHSSLRIGRVVARPWRLY